MPDTYKWNRADVVYFFTKHPASAGMDWQSFTQKYDIDLAGMGEQDATIPIEAFVRAFEDVASYIGNDACMFDLCRSIEIGVFSVFDYLFTCAPTFRRSCKAWEHYSPMRSNAYQVTYTENDTEGRVKWSLIEGYEHFAQYLFARMSWSVNRFELALATGDDAAPIRFSLPVPRPSSPSAFLDKYADQILFDQQEISLTIPKNILDIKPIGGDANLYAIIEKAAMEELEKHVQLSSPLSDIMAAMTTAMQTGTYTLTAVAEQLGTSPRSLQRQLEAEDTNFRQLSEELRKTKARHYLQETQLPMKEIAYLLGFSELSVFSRAVKNWFGASPRNLRQS